MNDLCVFSSFFTITHMMGPNAFAHASVCFMHLLHLCCFVWFSSFLNQFWIILLLSSLFSWLDLMIYVCFVRCLLLPTWWKRTLLFAHLFPHSLRVVLSLFLSFLNDFWQRFIWLAMLHPLMNIICCIYYLSLPQTSFRHAMFVVLFCRLGAGSADFIF